MVSVRRHNPYLRMRGKKGSGAIGKQVRFLFYALLLGSVIVAGLLLRRIGINGIGPTGSTTATIPGKGNLSDTGIKTPGLSRHQVHIGDSNNIIELPQPPPLPEDTLDEKRPRLRSPIDPDSHPSKQKQEQQAKQSEPTLSHAAAVVESQDSPTSAPTPAPQHTNPRNQDLLVGKMGEAQAKEISAVKSDKEILLNQKGSGGTYLGYVKDFAFEREHPAVFQPDEAALAQHTQSVSKLAGSPLQSCTTTSGSLSPICKDTDTVLYAYNNASFSRTICGVEVMPRQIVKLDALTDHLCLTEPARHIFPRDTLEGASQSARNTLPAIQVVAHPGGAHTAKMQSVEKCDAPCSYDTSLLFEDAPRERYIQGEDWTLLYDGPEKVPVMDKTDFQRDIYYSSVSRLSSIPVSSFSFDKYNFREAPSVDWKTADRAAGYFVQDNCQSQLTRRHKWMQALKAKYPVHAYGHCQHDTDGDLSTQQSRLALMRKNRLVLAFEVSGEKDAFTELTWEAFLSGSVPVVVGPSNAVQMLPRHSFLWFGTYNNWDKFAEDVAKVADNQTAWESYQAWRKDEAELAALEARMNFTKVSVECRTCRWAYAKMYGLHWDPNDQDIHPSVIPRDKFCVSTDALARVTKPFKEVWAGDEEEGGPEDITCEAIATQGEVVVEMDGYKLTRQVWFHDGITDISISGIETSLQLEIPITLRLQFDVKNFEGAYFPHTHASVESHNHYLASSATIQDYNSRVTVLADWKTTITSPEEGVIEVALPHSTQETLRIRVIIEDVDTLNFKLTEFYPFSFGKKMTLDFVNPIELYHPSTSRL